MSEILSDILGYIYKLCVVNIILCCRVVVKLLSVCVAVCFSEDIAKELQNVTLSDIRVVATLGVGGFGRVELVRTFSKLNHDFCIV